MLPLLTTKFFKPEPPDYFINRVRLEERLARGKNGKVTLVTAPAGYGKTTLISAWLNTGQGDNVCWLTLDEYDNDLSRFLHYFVAAWQSIDASLGENSLKLLQEGWAGPNPISAEAILIPLINELAQQQQICVFVLDDWHLIENAQIQHAIRYWIEHVPSQVHTILTTRTLPDFPIARWRVRGQLNEIGAKDLQFDQSETMQFFKEGMKLDLTEQQVQMLNEKTEGWIASLQLAAFSLQSSENHDDMVRDFTGSNRFVVDYLVDEVLAQQEEPYRAFLLETAVLTRFNSDLCNHVRQSNDSAEILEEMNRRNIFILALDNQRQWYRYHALFADYLCSLLKTNDSVKYKLLNKRAFEKLLLDGLFEEAIEYGLEAEVFDTIAQLLIEQSYSKIWQYNQAKAYSNWCQKLPEDYLIKNPQLMTSYGWSLLFSGQRAELQSFLRTHKDHMLDNTTAPDLKSQAIAIEAELFLHHGNSDEVIAKLNQIEFDQLEHQVAKALMYQVHGYANRVDGNVEQAIESLNKSRQLAQSTDHFALWLYATADLIDSRIIQGRFGEVDGLFDELANQLPPSNQELYPALQMISVYNGRLSFLRNEMATAIDQVQRGITLHAKMRSATKLLRFGVLRMAFIQQAQGNWDKAVSLMGELEHFVKSSQNSRLLAHYEAQWALLHLMQGHLDVAASWAANFEFERPESIPRLQYHEAQVIYGRYLLASQADNTVPWLNDCLQMAVKNEWGLSQLEIYITLAQAHHALNAHEAAQDALSHALDLAAPHRIIRPFIEAGQPMIILLRQALQQGVDNPFIGQLQAAFLPTAGVQSLVDPLTQREIEILGLMAEGLSNPEIANRLIVATGTIARHSNNIFGKLNVRNRTEATNRARTLGIL